MSVDVVCVGQALVDCITKAREEKEYKKNVYRAESITLNIGGDALNESSVLAGLGHEVRLVCGLGNDFAGKLVFEEARRRSINTDWITMSDELVTPIANLNVSQDGSRFSINSKAALLDGYLPPAAAFEGARIVSFASLFRTPLDQKEQVIDLIRKAKESGAIVCADTKIPTFRDIQLKDIKEALPLIDYIFPNENEAAFFTGKESYEDMGRAIQDMGVKNVIVKTGIHGSTIVGEKGTFHVDARKVNAVDSTGAGDNFVSGFLSGILRGWDIRRCAEFGTDCAANSVQYLGATSGILEWKKKGFCSFD